MRKNRFQFKIDGKGVSPETVSVADLFDIVKALEAACAASAKASDAKNADELSVSIVGINDGSDKLTIAASDRMFKAASKVSHAIASNNYSSLPAAAQSRIRDLWCKSAAKNWSFSFLADGNGIADAQITPENEVLKPTALSGRTVLYGLCERIGGAKRQTMQFLLLSGERFNVTIKTKILAQEISSHLHKPIGVEGVATWDVDTWKLDEFVVDTLLEYFPTDPKSAIEALAVASEGFWDDVNPDEYVSELRAD